MRLQRSAERPTQRVEQADLVESAIAGRRQATELAEHAFAGGPRDERRRRAKQAFRVLVHAEAQLVLEPDGPEEPQRIVDEDRLGHGTHDACLEVRADRRADREHRHPRPERRSR